MSTVESPRSCASNDPRIESLQHSPTKELDDLIQSVAKTHLYIFQLKKELQFLRDLKICLLSPSNFADQTVYNRLIINLKFFTENQNRLDLPSLIKGQEKLDRDYKSIDSGIKQRKHLFNSNKIQKLIQLNSVTENICKEIDNDLSFIATGYQFVLLTSDDWKAIRATFEKKNLPFSEDFMNRCQRVAQKALAA